MHELHPNLLWLGHAFDIREPRPLYDVAITAVVDVAFEESPAMMPRDFIYLRFPLNDGGGNEPCTLRLAIQTVVELLHSGNRTIVACSVGMSRSPTIAAFALAFYLGISPELALERIAAMKSLEIKGQLWNDCAAIFPEVRRPI